MLKNELRLGFLHRRQKLTETRYGWASKKIAGQCLILPLWDLKRFHIFLPVKAKKEVDTSYLIRALRQRDKEVVVPRVEGPGQLSHFLVDPKTNYKNNKWGIPEPVDGREVSPDSLDVVFLPLLAFDAAGYRVGYGGGYYDRFLGACKTKPITVGLSFFEPVPAITDLHGQDLKMQYAVTPEHIYEF